MFKSILATLAITVAATTASADTHFFTCFDSEDASIVRQVTFDDKADKVIVQNPFGTTLAPILKVSDISRGDNAAFKNAEWTFISVDGVGVLDNFLGYKYLCSGSH